MPLPCPGPAQISLLDLQNEFGGSSPIGLAEYYRNGGYVGSNNTNVPTGGTIGLNNFFCAVNEIVRYITSTSTNVNASSYFTSGEWTSPIPKTLIINSGVIVGGTNTSTPALTIPGFGGSFKLINYGSVQGAGGGPGASGGTAIVVGAPAFIDNLGSIYGGGGGGGTGGTGGSGLCRETTRVQSGCQQGAISCPGGWNQYASGNWCCQWRRGCAANIWWRECERYYYTSGGAGGVGGRGQGYDGANAGGAGGQPGGGCGAGTGGTGGTGGSFGNTGNTGNTGFSGTGGAGTGGSGGGPAGFYIQGNGNVTWLNTGTRGGRVG